MTNEDRDNLLLYAAGALADDEAAALRARLALGAPEEVGALAEAEAILALLPLGLEPVAAPSTGAKGRLMAGLAPRGGASSSSTAGNIASGGTDQPLRITPSTAPARASFWPAFLGLAAAVAIFAVSVVFVMHERGAADQRARAAEKDANERVASMQTQLVTAELSLQTIQVQLASAKQAMDVVTSEQLQLVGLGLPAANPKSKARGRIFWDREKNQWLVTVTDLMPPAAGRAYELWFITPDQKKVPSKVFHTNATTGEATLLVDVPADVKQVALAAITDEPATGSLVPTGSIQLVGKVE